MTTLTKLMTTLCLLAIAKAEDFTTSESWGYGFLAGFCLSLVGFIAAFILVCFQKCLSESCFKILINQLYALACGAIIGDAIVHILPEAYKSEVTNERHVSLIFICAIGFFIILERIFKALGVAHQHWG
jgi:zinc transporter ZupT